MKIERIPIPIKKTKPKISPALRKAVDAYKEAYKAVFRISPQLSFDGKWIRIKGQDAGVTTKRLKELTTQLRNRL